MTTCEIIHLIIGWGENWDGYPQLCRKKESEDPLRKDKRGELSKKKKITQGRIDPVGWMKKQKKSRQKFANSLKSSGHKRQKNQEDDKNLTKEVGVSESWIHTCSLLEWMTLRPSVSVKKLSWEEVGKEGRDCLEEKPAVTWPAPLEC